METNVSFEEILRAWLLSYDDRLPSDRKEKIKAFIVLLGNLYNYGYKKDSITSGKKERIVKSCVNPNYPKNRLKGWISVVVNALEAAILIYYGTVKIEKNIVTPEMEEKINAIHQKAEESKSLKKKEDNSLDSESEIIDIDSAIADAVDKPTIQMNEEELQITDDMFNETDGPQVAYDPDFYKKLGL